MQLLPDGALSEPVTRIGKYQIIEQVGEGAMGVVYKATDPVLNRTVAIKVMSEGLAQDESLRERFLREAQAAGSLQHPNVVTVYDFGETDGHLFIAMEFVQGADLEQLLTNNAPMTLSAKLDIMIDVLNGLSYAHRRGIVHRDIKPANIRVDEEGRARIMDFGVARLSTSNLTGTGVMMGTPNYMAPEQITGGELTPSVDLFSVGAVLYELLTNAKPFQADTLHRVLFKIVSDPTPDLLELVPDLPKQLDHIVKKALAKEPANRYRNATDMANSLSAVRAIVGAPRPSRTVSQRSSIEQSLRLQREARIELAARPARNDRRWAAIFGTLAALLAFTAVALYARRQLPPAPALPAPSTAAVTAAGAPTDTGAPMRAARDSGQPSQALATQPIPQVARNPEREAVRPGPSGAAPRQERPRETARTATVDSSRRDRAADAARVAANAPAPAAPATQSASQTTSVSVPPVTIAAPPQAPPVATPLPTPAPPVPENPRPAIASIIDAYAKAIGTRQVAEVRRVYPGMTPAQQSGWESLFSSVRTMNATFDIASLDVQGTTAIARLSGAYDYVTRAGRSERQPALIEATFQRDGERWKLSTVR